MKARHVALALTAVLGLAGPGEVPAQQRDQATVFRSATRLIVQAVTVTDRDGKPITDLGLEDFRVTENGVVQRLAFVEFERLDRPDTPPSDRAGATASEPRRDPPTSIPSTARVPSLPPGRMATGRRLVALYLDVHGMSFFDRLRACSAADTYVATLATPIDLVALMVFDGVAVRLVQDFTDNRSLVREALAELVGGADTSSGGAGIVSTGTAFGDNDDVFNIFSTDRQLSALQTAVADLAPLPGIKTLVYLGSRLRLNGVDNQAQLRATVNAAVRANVTLNPIDARGLVASLPLGDATRASPGGVGMFSGTVAQAAFTRDERARDALHALAPDTGGRAVFDTNDLAAGIADVAGALTSYYLIGYYSTHSEADGRLRRVTIALTGGRAARLSYRPGYHGDKPFTRFTRVDKERHLAEALRLDDPITDIPIAMTAHYFQLNQAEYYVPISVRIPALDPVRAGSAPRVEIDMIGEIKDAFGVTVQNVRDTLRFQVDSGRMAARPLQYETGFTLLPGLYTIKVLARDASSGRLGTFEAALTVPNLDRAEAPLPISSVVLAVQRIDAGNTLHGVRQKISTDEANPLIVGGRRLIPEIGTTFRRSERLTIFLHAYQPGASSLRPIVAFVALYRGDERVTETAARVFTEEWDVNARAVPVSLELETNGLDAGDYVCQVTVLDPEASRATFWRTSITLVL